MRDVLAPETRRMLEAAATADDLRAATAAVDRDVARAEHARRTMEFANLQARASMARG